MIFLSALPRTSLNIHAEMTLDASSERELIERRIEAANRVRHKRLVLKLGLAVIRRSWRQANRSSMPQLLSILHGQRT